MGPYNYHQPESLGAALALLAAEPDARLVAGGTDLMVNLRKRRAEPPSALVSLRGVPEMTQLALSPEGELRIGAALCLTDILAHAEVQTHYPALVEALHVFGSLQIQNAATLGGNLCNASPGADAVPALLVYDARVELVGLAGPRVLPLTEFLRGPGQTDLKRGEVMTAVLLERPPARTQACFLRMSRVKMDLATVSLALSLVWDGTTCTRARLAAGAVAPVVLRLREAEALLEGSDLSDDVLARAAESARATVAPIDDLRSTAAYRRTMVGVLLERGGRRLRAAAQKGATA